MAAALLLVTLSACSSTESNSDSDVTGDRPDAQAGWSSVADVPTCGEWFDSGTDSQIIVDLLVDTSDGDLTSQYVFETANTCATLPDSPVTDAMLKTGLERSDLKVNWSPAAGQPTCDPSQPVDRAVCDDLDEIYTDAPNPEGDCDLADGVSAFTPAFAEVADSRSRLRCLVPDDAGLIAAAVANGLEIDGVADLGEEGDPDYSISYLSWEPCLVEPTYWPATGNWSTYKATSPKLTQERLATPAEAVAAAVAQCQS